VTRGADCGCGFDAGCVLEHELYVEAVATNPSRFLRLLARLQKRRAANLSRFKLDMRVFLL
jgi:hypothetical protein